MGNCTSVTYNTVSSNEKLKEIPDELDRMEKKYADLEKRFAEKNDENSCLGKDMFSKIEAFESKIETLGQCIQEKDDRIAILEKRLNDLKNKVESQSKHFWSKRGKK